MKRLMVRAGLLVLVALWCIWPDSVEASTLPVQVGPQLAALAGGLSASIGVPVQSGWVLDRPCLEKPQPPEWERSLRCHRRRVIRHRRRRSPPAVRRLGQGEPPHQENQETAAAIRLQGKPAAAPVGVTETGRAVPVASGPEPMLKAWVAEELAAVQLHDGRLERRLRLLVEQLAEQPTASIPQACGTSAAAKAAYRFFDNRKVSHPAILDGHRVACLRRVADQECMLVLQDTTSLDYTHHPETVGLGPLEKAERRGLLVHSSMAASEVGVPLGLLDQQVWTRDPEAVGQRHQRKRRAIEEKESAKWLHGLRASLKDVPAQVCVVTVADREADIFDFFLEAEARQTQVVVRAAWNRRLTDPPGYLWEAVARTAVRGRFTVEVGRARDRLPRQATVQVRFAPLVIRPPRHRLAESGLHPLPLYAIEVREETPSPGEKPLHWLLLTSRSVESFAEAQRCVRWYGLRWLVERYHFVLKSGCRIEERQLETGPRLERCLGVYAIVAWRLLWLTYQARLTPQKPCSVALETREWQALYCYIHQTTTPPVEPPSLHQATRWIAQLGGFLGRKGDGEPGVKVLWRGWQRLHDIADTYQLFHPPPDVGNA